MNGLVDYNSDYEIDDVVDNETAAAVALVLCEMCKNKPRAYKCPRCSVMTCSLECCRAHKAQMDCNGIRDRTGFVSMGSFTDSNLRNDYHFLEDVLQVKHRAKALCGSDNASKHHYVANPKPIQPPSDLIEHKNQVNSNSLNNGTKKMLRACRERNTQWIALSNGMIKRKVNTSHFKPKVGVMMWRLHIVFVTSSQFEVSDLLRVDPLEDRNEHFTKRNHLVEFCFPTILETTTISTVLDKLFESHTQAEHAIARHLLRNLRSVSRTQWSCLIQKIPSPSNQPLFYEVPLHFSLRDALDGKTVIEFPTLFVGVASDLQKVQRAIFTLTTLATTQEAAKKRPLHQSSSSSHPQKRMTTNNNNNNNNKVNDSAATTTTVQEEANSEKVNDDDDDDEDDNDDDEELENGDSEKMQVCDNNNNNDDDNDDDEPLLISNDEFLELLHEVENSDIETLRKIVEQEELQKTW